MTSTNDVRVQPPKEVLAAFGETARPTPLFGGRGLAWRAGSIVVKPADASEDSLAWQAQTLDKVRPESIRIGRPERSIRGPYIVDGWTASTFCVGRHEPRRWSDIIAAGRHLHRSLAHVARPSFLALRTDPWAVADRAAWGESSLAPYRAAPHIALLEAVVETIPAPSQLIHGDLTGNVLFADPVPPAVIDLSPYWRPAEFATAIVVADAIVWEGGRLAELTPSIETEWFGQHLVRALLYRIVADLEADPDSMVVRAPAYAPAVTIAIGLARRHR